MLVCCECESVPATHTSGTVVNKLVCAEVSALRYAAFLLLFHQFNITGQIATQMNKSVKL